MFRFGRVALFSVLGLGAVYAQELPQVPRPFTTLYDTGKKAMAALTPDDLSHTDQWQIIEPDNTEHAFRGDAVVANDRLALVVRRGASDVELYAFGSGGPSLRSSLRPLAGTDAGPIESMAIKQNGQDAVVLEVAFEATLACALRIELDMGQVYVKTQAVGATSGVRISAPCRFAVMPDFFADDIVLDAQAIPVNRAEQPSENFLMHLLDGGNAIVMAVWDNRNQDVAVNLTGAGSVRRLESTDIDYGNGGGVWVAVLEDPGVWHVRDLTRDDLGNEIALDWLAPYHAIWRVDWRRTTGLTDSWEMIVENPDGSFTKPDLFEQVPDDWAGQKWWSKAGPRWRWNTVLGRYLYPCWFDKDGKVHLQPIKETFNWTTNEEGSFHPLPEDMLWVGPAVVFPVDRASDTPLDKFSVTDVVRATLGVGPCEYILDVEGQKSQFRGSPTCAVRDKLNAIYKKGQQQERKTDVEQALDDVLTFIKLIRGRIDTYEVFSNDMAVYLAEQKQAHPELTGFVRQMETANAAIAEAVNRRREGIKSISYAAGLVDEFRANVVDSQGPDAYDRCQEITLAWVHMGDNQDELVAECRLAVKVLRQQAALAGAADPQTAGIVREIRRLTQGVLRSPASYEASRH